MAKDKAKAKETVLMVMGTSCPEECAEEFSQWYSEKHVPDILKFPGIKKAARLQLIHKQGLAPAGESAAQYPEFLAIYEYENWKAVEDYNKWPGRAAILEDFNKNWAPKGAKLDWRIFYKPIKSWGKWDFPNQD